MVRRYLFNESPTLIERVYTLGNAQKFYICTSGGYQNTGMFINDNSAADNTSNLRAFGNVIPLPGQTTRFVNTPITNPQLVTYFPSQTGPNYYVIKEIEVLFHLSAYYLAIKTTQSNRDDITYNNLAQLYVGFANTSDCEYVLNNSGYSGNPTITQVVGLDRIERAMDLSLSTTEDLPDIDRIFDPGAITKQKAPFNAYITGSRTTSSTGSEVNRAYYEAENNFQQFAAAYDGSLQAYSALDAGPIFRATLPAERYRTFIVPPGQWLIAILNAPLVCRNVGVTELLQNNNFAFGIKVTGYYSPNLEDLIPFLSI